MCVCGCPVPGCPDVASAPGTVVAVTSPRRFAQRFLATDYLRTGNAQQQAAAHTLDALDLHSLVTARDWVLAGTIPIDIAIDGSDLDVLVWADDPAATRDELTERFGMCPGFASWPHGREANTWCVSFDGDGAPVEFFIQNVPVAEQRAFRHMVAEAALLEAHGVWLRERVLELKRAGIKTEPAFAQALGLELGEDGDPYLALLDTQVLEAALRG